MKTFRYIIGLIVLSAFASCEKETMTFEGMDTLYFDVRWGSEWGDPEKEWAHQYYTPIEFGLMTEADTTLQLRVRCTGGIKDYDRPFTVTVNADSTNAIAGEDYTGFEEQHVIKAGEQWTYVTLAMHRTERMADEDVYLQLQLHANDYFALNFSNYGDHPDNWAPETVYGSNPDASVHKVVANDKLTRPDGWIGQNGLGIFGDFSPTKFRLMMEITDTSIEDYANSTVMTMGRANAIGEEFGRYLLEQAAKGREYAVLDEDGTMMWVNAVTTLGGSQGWSSYTTLDEYYR